MKSVMAASRICSKGELTMIFNRLKGVVCVKFPLDSITAKVTRGRQSHFGPLSRIFNAHPLAETDGSLLVKKMAVKLIPALF